MSDYISYVEEQIKKIKDMTNLIKSGQIQPSRLNYCLAEFLPTMWMLVAEYQRLKTLHIEEDKQYKMWWDEVFLKARDDLNANRVQSKYASKTEIESQARVDNKEEFFRRTDRLRAFEEKKDFIFDMISYWKKQDAILANLSYNIRAELKALDVDDWTNNSAKKADKDNSNRKPNLRRRRQISE